MKLWRAAIFTLVLSEKLSHFNTLSCKPTFLHTFETCSLKVKFFSISIPNSLTDSSFSNVVHVLCSVRVPSATGRIRRNTICSSRQVNGREKKGFHNKSGYFVIPIGMMLKIHQNGLDKKNTGEFPMADVLSKLIG